MKKKWYAALIMALVIAGAAFAEEYTFYFNGTDNESVTVQKDRNGKTTIFPQLSEDGSARGGNTAAKTKPDKSWTKTVIEGNTETETETPSNSSGQRQVFNGNTTIQINTNGGRRELVISENILIISDSYDPERGCTN